MKNRVEFGLRIDSAYMKNLSESEQQRLIKLCSDIPPASILQQIETFAKAGDWGTWRAVIAVFASMQVCGYEALLNEGELETDTEAEFLRIFGKQKQFYENLTKAINTMDKVFNEYLESESEHDAMVFFAAATQMLDNLSEQTDRLESETQFVVNKQITEDTTIHYDYYRLASTMGTNLEFFGYIVIGHMIYLQIACSFADWLEQLNEAVGQFSDHKTHNQSKTRQ